MDERFLPGARPYPKKITLPGTLLNQPVLQNQVIDVGVEKTIESVLGCLYDGLILVIK